MERVLNYTAARRNLKSVMDTVITDRVPVVITRTTSEPVVMLAKSEHDAMMETFHLLRSPKNAERLRVAIAEAEDGDVVRVALSDDRVERKSGGR